MKLAYIGFQSLGDDTVPLSGNRHIPFGKRKACGLSDMIFADVQGHTGHVGYRQIGTDVGQYGYQNIVQCRKIRLLCLGKSQFDDLPLPLCSGIIRIHQPQPPICHCLNTIQMMSPRTF